LMLMMMMISPVRIDSDRARLILRFFRKHGSCSCWSSKFYYLSFTQFILDGDLYKKFDF